MNNVNKINLFILPIKKALSFLDQPLIYFALRFGLIFYAITLIPKVTDDIINFIESPIGKLILFLLISLIYIKDQSLALLFGFILMLTIFEYHNGKKSFQSIVVDRSGKVIGNVLRGTSDIAKDIGEAGANVVGVTGEATSDIIKTVGKGSAETVAVVSGAAEDIIRTSANISSDLTKDVSGTIKELGTQEDENLVEAFDGGCSACMM